MNHIKKWLSATTGPELTFIQLQFRFCNPERRRTENILINHSDGVPLQRWSVRDAQQKIDSVHSGFIVFCFYGLEDLIISYHAIGRSSTSPTSWPMERTYVVSFCCVQGARVEFDAYDRVLWGAVGCARALKNYVALEEQSFHAAYP